jgi:SAM-dependent methyltransferase
MKQVIGRFAKRIDMAFHKFVEMARRDGVRRAFTGAVAYAGRMVKRGDLLDDDFDRTWKVNTSGTISLWHMSIDSPNAKFGAAYSPSDPAWIEWALARISEDFSTFTFIDLGCGKGRALMVASHHGFCRVVGVEFARELVEAGRRNLLACGIEGAEIILEDAANFLFPEGNLVVYVFNPFSPEVLRPVLDKLAGRKGLHKTYFIFVNPLYASLVDATTGFSPVAAIDGKVSARIWRCH